MSAQTFSADERTDHEQPPVSSELDIYNYATRPGASDGFLRETNFGLGNYKPKEMWQQVDSYSLGLFANAAFGRTILDRAIEDTKCHLARHGCTVTRSDEEVSFDGWQTLSEDKQQTKDRRRYISEQADAIWNSLSDTEKLELTEQVTGITDSWTPPHWRMMQVRHETSRSRGSRLLDNVFGRIKEVLGNGSSNERRLRGPVGGDER